MKNTTEKEPRKGCRDIWNAFMVEGALFSRHDIPYCPTTATKLPKSIITWEEAKAFYRWNLANRHPNFHLDAFVCWYIDDYKFDSPQGIWYDSQCAQYVLDVLRHFAGAITPDFSTYQDFPEPIKLYNTYRMRAFGYWLGKNCIPVINNVRWGTPETYWYCFDGIPQNSVVAIGTCGGSPRELENRKRFEVGLTQMVNVLSPRTVLVYGSANYPCFEELRQQGIRVIAYPSQMARAFDGRATE